MPKRTADSAGRIGFMVSVEMNGESPEGPPLNPIADTHGLTQPAIAAFLSPLPMEADSRVREKTVISDLAARRTGGPQ